MGCACTHLTEFSLSVVFTDVPWNKPELPARFDEQLLYFAGPLFGLLLLCLSGAYFVDKWARKGNLPNLFVKEKELDDHGGFMEIFQFRLREHHNWLSIALRRHSSGFTSVQRTCVAFTHAILQSAVAAAFFSEEGALKMDQMIGVAIMSVLVSAPVPFIAQRLFLRRGRQLTTQITEESEKSGNAQVDQCLEWPGDVHIGSMAAKAAYFMLFCFSTGGCFWIVTVTVAFDDEKMHSWLVSNAMSIAVSILGTSMLKHAAVLITLKKPAYTLLTQITNNHSCHENPNEIRS